MKYFALLIVLTVFVVNANAAPLPECPSVTNECGNVGTVDETAFGGIIEALTGESGAWNKAVDLGQATSGGVLDQAKSAVPAH
ncbi:MAG: hypothetical protein J3R72DRAFT_436027 [Linnemannia gamsii]|nr:MAG: hypothetical protein J3R72DRAFT_436027 [Linnemannia gamsii]